MPGPTNPFARWSRLRTRDAVAASMGRASEAWTAWTEAGIEQVAARLLRPREAPGEIPGTAAAVSSSGRGFLSGSTCERCGGRGTVGGYHGEDDDWEEDSWTCSDCDATGIVRDGRHIAPRPRRDDGAALARVAQWIPRVEAYARAASRRLAPWGSPPVNRVVWRVGGIPRSPHFPGNPGYELLHGLLRSAFNDALDGSDPPALVKLLGNGIPGSGDFYADALLAWRHREAGRRGLRIPASYEHWGREVDLSNHPLAGTLIGDRLNPMTPWLKIWSLGFALDGIRDYGIVLYCPRAG